MEKPVLDICAGCESPYISFGEYVRLDTLLWTMSIGKKRWEFSVWKYGYFDKEYTVAFTAIIDFAEENILLPIGIRNKSDMLLNYLDDLDTRNIKKNCTFYQHEYICYMKNNHSESYFGSIKVMIDNTYITIPSENYVALNSFLENDEVVYAASLKMRGVFTNTIVLGRPFITLFDLKFDYSNLSLGIQ